MNEQDILAENAIHGGTAMVKYKDTDFAAGVPLAHLYEALEILQKKPDRKDVMKKISRHIDSNYEAGMRGELTQADALGLAQDVGLWFANEVLEGRKTMEELEVLGRQ